MDQIVKNLPTMQEIQLESWVQKILWRRELTTLSSILPWRRKWQPAPVFLPGESHGWRSLEGYSPRGCKESDMTE